MNVEANKAASREWHESFGTPNLKSAYEKFLAKDFRALFFGHGWVDRDSYMKGDQKFALLLRMSRWRLKTLLARVSLCFAGCAGAEDKLRLCLVFSL